MKWLEHVLTRIKDAGLTINREKSEYCRNEIKFLVVLINRDGYKPNPDKIAQSWNIRRQRISNN